MNRALMLLIILSLSFLAAGVEANDPLSFLIGKWDDDYLYSYHVTNAIASPANFVAAVYDKSGNICGCAYKILVSDESATFCIGCHRSPINPAGQKPAFTDQSVPPWKFYNLYEACNSTSGSVKLVCIGVNPTLFDSRKYGVNRDYVISQRAASLPGYCTGYQSFGPRNPISPPVNPGSPAAMTTPSAVSETGINVMPYYDQRTQAEMVKVLNDCHRFLTSVSPPVP